MGRGFTLLCPEERIASLGVLWLTVSVKHYLDDLFPVLQFTATNYQEHECHVIWHRLFVKLAFNIGIKHDFPFINIRKVPREVLKTEGEARGFQHLPRDLAHVNEWQNHVWSLLLHKFKENTPKIEKMFAHFILQPYHHFLTRARFL